RAGCSGQLACSRETRAITPSRVIRGERGASERPVLFGVSESQNCTSIKRSIPKAATAPTAAPARIVRRGTAGAVYHAGNGQADAILALSPIGGSPCAAVTSSLSPT